MVTPQYNFVHILKRLNLMHNKLPTWKHCERGFIWIVTLQDFLHGLKTSWTTLHLSTVDTGSVVKGKSGRQHNEKKIHRTRSREALWAIGLLVLVFTILRQNLWGSNKKEWNLIIRLRQIFYCLLQQLSLSLYIFFATGKPETWKESHHERDPSVRDIFPYVACLIIGAGNERRKGILRPSSDAVLLSCRT